MERRKKIVFYKILILYAIGKVKKPVLVAVT
jgi:hypothetical protein